MWADFQKKDIQAALEKKGIWKIDEPIARKSIAENKVICRVKVALRQLKDSRRTTDKKNYAFLLGTIAGKKRVDAHIRKELQIRFETWRKYSSIDTYVRAPRADKVPNEAQEAIVKFYDSVSSMLGGKRYNLKGGIRRE